MPRTVSRWGARLGALVFLTACGGPQTDGPVTPTDSPRTYTGTFAAGGQRGTLTLTSGASPTGTLHVNGIAGDVALTGTFASATSTFSMTGGGYTVTAQPATGTQVDVVPDGVASSPTGPVFATSASPAILTGTVMGGALAINGTLTVVSSSTGATVSTTRYCGVATGPDAAMMDLIINGTTAAANITIMGGQGTMTGTATASTATVSITNPQRTNTLTATFTFDGTTATGTGRSTAYPNDPPANIIGTTAGCIDATAPAAYTSYVAMGTLNGQHVKLDLTPGTPATGTITLGANPVTLTGTFTPGTGAGNGTFQLTGGNYTVTAVAADSGVSGTAVVSTGGTTFQLTGLGSNAATVANRYCGTWSGLRNGTTKTGSLWFITRGASAKMISGGMGSSFVTANAGGNWIFGRTPSGYAYLAGTLSGTTFTGTYTDTDDYLGTFTVSPC